MNALRAVLYEYGQVIPQSIGHIKRIEAIVENAEIGLPELVQEECRDLPAQIGERTARIEEKATTLAQLSRQSETARRIQTMPGVGPLIALAVEAFAPAMQSFRCGRDFAAWLGLVPRQFSFGGKERLGRVSKASQADIRRLLILGGNGPRELGGSQTASPRIVAFADAREEAAHAGGDRTGEQDGGIVGHADEAGRIEDPALAVAA